MPNSDLLHTHFPFLSRCVFHLLVYHFICRAIFLPTATAPLWLFLNLFAGIESFSSVFLSALTPRLQGIIYSFQNNFLIFLFSFSFLK